MIRMLTLACLLLPAGCGGTQSALGPAGPGAARIGDIWWLMLAVCAAVFGLVMLVLLQTEANFFNFQVATCVVSFLIGTLLVLAGLYGKRGTKEEAEAEDEFRHSGRGPAASHAATPSHHLSAHPGVVHPEKRKA